MLDIRFIREKPDFVRERLATRGGGDEAKIDEVLRVDAERRQMETALQQLNADRKRLSKEIGGKKSRSEPTDELEQRVRQIGDQIADVNSRKSHNIGSPISVHEVKCHGIRTYRSLHLFRSNHWNSVLKGASPW